MTEELISIVKSLSVISKLKIKIFDKANDLIFESNSKVSTTNLKIRKSVFTSISKTAEISSKANCYCIQIDNASFLISGLWNNEIFQGILSCGPFFTSIPVTNNLDTSLKLYYQSLPILNNLELNSLATLIVNITPGRPTKPNIIKNSTDFSFNIADNQSISSYNEDIINSRYSNQRSIMTAISTGNKELADSLIGDAAAFLSPFSQRTPNRPLRSAKNIAFVFNTMCRIASEHSSVAPIYLHLISEKYALIIERSSTLAQLAKSIHAMSDDYCDLVVKLNNNRYSAKIKKSISFINLRYSEPIKLNDIAIYSNTNPAYLSRKFKQETGQSVIGFLNRTKINKAQNLIKNTDNSITDVSILVGFNNLTYFCKVFKNITGTTPSSFQKNLGLFKQ